MIPAAAVEAAAKKFASILANTKWEHLGPLTQDAYRDHARAALESAAPYIAGAWHDAVSEAYVEGALSAEQANAMWAKSPYRRPE